MKAYMNGVGRVRRDPFTLYVGDRQIDVDELRVHHPRGRLEPLVRELPGGPTPAEAAWLMWFCCGGEYGGLDVVRMLNTPPKFSNPKFIGRSVIPVDGGFMVSNDGGPHEFREYGADPVGEISAALGGSGPPFTRRVGALLDTGERPAVLRLGETALRPLMEGVAALSGRNLTGMRFVVDPIVTEHGVPTGSNNVWLEVTTEGPVDGGAQPAHADQGG